MKKTLINTLRAVGKPYRIRENPDGSTVLVLPYGARVLGLFAPRSEENFLWTHPALATAESAAEFYKGKDWHNSGGDRTWLSPEADFFFPKFPKIDVYWQPRELDPGNYQVIPGGEEETLTTRAKSLLSRSKAQVEWEIAKAIGPTANPLAHERGLAQLPVEFAGYTLRTSLKLLSGSAPIGLWNLLQMPHGGDLLIPTYAKTRPKVIFGQMGADDLQTGDRLVRYRMRSKGDHKISVRAIAVAGRIGYLHPERDGRWALIVRNVSVNPSGLYVDFPWDDLNDLGYAVQGCNVNGSFGTFGELEYHVPAVGPGTGRTRCDDVSQVWAFRGDRSSIERAAKLLLGANTEQ
jgi:hypothetical protein